MRKAILLVLFLFTNAFLIQAQIFINTGNPNLEKYKREVPNAVIWDKGSKIPIPPNTPADPAVMPKSSTSKSYSANTPAPANTYSHSTPSSYTTSLSSATSTGIEYPPYAVPGKCYARCIAPDQYEYREQSVLVKPATYRIERIPARYETVHETVIVRPATVKKIPIPARYEILKEQQLVRPAREEWVKGKATQNCLSRNPKDCQVWCLKQIPAVYKTVERRVEVEPASTREEIIPEVTKVVTRKKLVEPARENKIEIPAVYKTVMKKVLIKKGGFEEWREVLCDQDLTDTRIRKIQEALKREGYDPGPIDNIMGAKTKEALLKFQQDKGLPQGNLNLETLKALGVQ
ncbi:MAG: peptidoglycan-binding protein [Chitinophagales bacterium]|nr:peptidoglycan-binding protein [Chitinophagales bacterium]MDW8419595.1 peptidoglycan-binding domain-containing protein [Chitinophagales bacterium]